MWYTLAAVGGLIWLVGALSLGGWVSENGGPDVETKTWLAGVAGEVMATLAEWQARVGVAVGLPTPGTVCRNDLDALLQAMWEEAQSQATARANETLNRVVDLFTRIGDPRRV